MGNFHEDNKYFDMNNRNHDKSLDTSWEGWDDQEIWGNINDALDKKSKRRLLPFFIFFWSTALLMVIILVNQTKFKSTFKPLKPIAQDIHGVKISHQHSSKDINCSSLSIPSNKLENDKISTTKDFKSSSNIKNNGHQILKKEVIKFQNISTIKRAQNEIVAFEPTSSNLQNEEIFIDNSVRKNNINTLQLSQIPWQSLKSNIVNTNHISSELQVRTSSARDSQKTLFDKSRIDISIDHGIGFGRRTEIVDMNIPWQQLTHQNDQYLYSTNHQINILKTFKNGWNINTGFSYLRHISNLQGSTQTISTAAFESDSARVQQIDGIIFYHEGQRTKTITKTNVYDVYNTHSILQIPIQIGYTIPIKNNMLRLAFGTNYTIAQTLQGYTYDGPNRIISYNLLTNQKIKNSIGFNDFTSSVHFIHPITKKIGINVGYDISLPLRPYLKISENQSKEYARSNTLHFIKLGLILNIQRQ